MPNTHSIFKILTLLSFPLMGFSAEKENQQTLAPTPLNNASNILPPSLQRDFKYKDEEYWVPAVSYNNIPFPIPSTQGNIEIMCSERSFSPKNSPLYLINFMKILWQNNSVLQVTINVGQLGRPLIDSILLNKKLAYPKTQKNNTISYSNTLIYPNSNSNQSQAMEEFLKNLYENNVIPLFFIKYLQNFTPPLPFKFLSDSQNLYNYMNDVPIDFIKSEEDYFQRLGTYFSLLKTPTEKYNALHMFLSNKKYFINNHTSRIHFSLSKENKLFIILVKLEKKRLDLLKQADSFLKIPDFKIRQAQHYTYLGHTLKLSKDKFDDKLLEQIFPDCPYKNNREDLILYYFSTVTKSLYADTTLPFLRGFEFLFPEFFKGNEEILRELFPFSKKFNPNAPVEIESIQPLKDYFSFIDKQRELITKNKTLEEENEKLKQRLAELSQKNSDNPQNNNTEES